jgi:multisubunit Na+/H+ antiporter MnhB subunit
MEDEPEEKPTTPEQARFIGAAVGAIGLGLVLLALDIIPQRWWPPNVPPAVLFIIGVLLVSASAAVFSGLGTPASSFFVGVSMALMAMAFAWVAFLGEARHMSGGIPFLPRWLNVGLGRAVFGLASLAFLAVAVSAFRSAINPPEEG